MNHDVSIRRKPDGTTQIVPSELNWDEITRHMVMFSFVLVCSALAVCGVVGFEPAAISAAWAVAFELGLIVKRLLELRRPVAEVRVLRRELGMRR